MLGRIIKAILNLDLSPITIAILIAAVLVVVIIIITPPIVALLINLLISKQLSSAVKMKGHPALMTFLMCFFLGIPGYFYAIALPDVTKQKQLEKIINTLQTEKESEQAPEAAE